MRKQPNLRSLPSKRDLNKAEEFYLRGYERAEERGQHAPLTNIDWHDTQFEPVRRCTVCRAYILRHRQLGLTFRQCSCVEMPDTEAVAKCPRCYAPISRFRNQRVLLLECACALDAIDDIRRLRKEIDNIATAIDVKAAVDMLRKTLDGLGGTT